MLPAKPGPSKMRSCHEPRVVVLPSWNLRFSLVAVVFVAFLVSPVSHLKKHGEDVAMFCNHAQAIRVVSVEAIRGS